MVCIQVYFEIPYAPYTRKTDFFHKGSSELSVIMFMFRAMKGKNKCIITVKSSFFFFLKYICCHLWLRGPTVCCRAGFFLGSYSSSQWSQCRNVHYILVEGGKKNRNNGNKKRNENNMASSFTTQTAKKLQKKKENKKGGEGDWMGGEF